MLYGITRASAQYVEASDQHITATMFRYYKHVCSWTSVNADGFLWAACGEQIRVTIPQLWGSLDKVLHQKFQLFAVVY